MANPIPVSLPADTWTKVATAVTAGFVWIKGTRIRYLHTYRDTGGLPPTLGDQDEGMIILSPGIPISAKEAIDVYIFPIGEEGVVRVDL